MHYPVKYMTETQFFRILIDSSRLTHAVSHSSLLCCNFRLLPSKNYYLMQIDTESLLVGYKWA